MMCHAIMVVSSDLGVPTFFETANFPWLDLCFLSEGSEDGGNLNIMLWPVNADKEGLERHKVMPCRPTLSRRPHSPHLDKDTMLHYNHGLRSGSRGRGHTLNYKGSIVLPELYVYLYTKILNSHCDNARRHQLDAYG